MVELICTVQINNFHTELVFVYWDFIFTVESKMSWELLWLLLLLPLKICSLVRRGYSIVQIQSNKLLDLWPSGKLKSLKPICGMNVSGSPFVSGQTVLPMFSHYSSDLQVAVMCHKLKKCTSKSWKEDRCNIDKTDINNAIHNKMALKMSKEEGNALNMHNMFVRPQG